MPRRHLGRTGCLCTLCTGICACSAGLPNQTSGSRLLAPPRAVLWGTTPLPGDSEASGGPPPQVARLTEQAMALSPDAMSSVQGASGTMAVQHWQCGKVPRWLCQTRLLLSEIQWLMWQGTAGLSCHVSLDGDVPAMSAVESWQPSDASLRLRTHR
jgi:hypothetical protein